MKLPREQARAGASMAAALGMTHWVVRNPDEYAKLASLYARGGVGGREAREELKRRLGDGGGAMFDIGQRTRPPTLSDSRNPQWRDRIFVKD